MNITKKTWMQLHTTLSIFFLPVALLYVITGVGYIFEFKDNAWASIDEFNLPNMPKKGEEKEFILNFLNENGITIPKNTEIKMIKGVMTMGNIKYNVSVSENKKDNTAKLSVMNRSLYGVMVLMHKSKGAYYFDILAIGFSISLVLFYLSGLIMTSFCKKNRKNASIFFVIGLITTIIAIYFSI